VGGGTTSDVIKNYVQNQGIQEEKSISSNENN
jgi:hypothetical protein